MSDYLVYWKDFWSDVVGDPGAPIEFDWHTARKSFFRDVEENDCLWVVVTGGKNHPDEWRLLERLVVRTKQVNQEQERPFEIVGNDAASQRFDIEDQTDFGPQLQKLNFATGKKLRVSGAAIGNALQAIRLLAPADVAFLKEYSGKLDIQASANRKRSNKGSSRSALKEFFRQASFYRYHPKFQEWEREYKIQLANALAKSRNLLTSNSSTSLETLVSAVKSKDDNIIDWRDRKKLLRWLGGHGAIESLRVLWDPSLDLYQRFASVAETLSGAGVTQAGGQLAITSTFLMAFGAEQFPPVKVDSFYKAMKLAGYPSLYKAKTAVKRYRIARIFMNEMVAEAPNFQVELNDNLDVQGVVWCVSGGWGKIPVPPDWVNHPEARAKAERAEYEKELRELEKELDAPNLTPTQKLALVKARRGQGKFREDLVKYWSCCAVTQCAELRMLIASHIMPWKDSDNRQRLDKFNGLLLSPNLDRAFDKGLISFEDSGQIKISKDVTTADKKLLGIHSRLRLSKSALHHKPYLKHHRDQVFERWKRSQDFD
jgi:hypothetical protein